MFPQLYTAASGMIAGEQTLDLVAGNLANLRTPGFRPDRPLFQTYLSSVTAAGVPGGKPVAPRSVMLANAWRSEEQGPLHETGAPLDLALQGPGWFRVQTARGERVTRAGSFTRSQDGKLATGNGDPLLDINGQPIRLEEGRIVVTEDGSVTVDGAEAGKLGLVDVKAQSLIREGETLWKTSGPTTPIAPGTTRVRQGYIEESGVNATSELVTMIEAQRLYEMQQKLLDVTANQLARKAIELGEPR